MLCVTGPVPRTPRKLDLSSLSREQREAMSEPSPCLVLIDSLCADCQVQS